MGKIVKVVFEWDDSKGPCYDCGLPAAYLAPYIYKGRISQQNLFCSVCAARHAAEGQRITSLWPDDENEIMVWLDWEDAKALLARAEAEEQADRLDDEDKAIYDKIEEQLKRQTSHWSDAAQRDRRSPQPLRPGGARADLPIKVTEVGDDDPTYQESIISVARDRYPNDERLVESSGSAEEREASFRVARELLAKRERES